MEGIQIMSNVFTITTELKLNKENNQMLANTFLIILDYLIKFKELLFIE